MEIIDPTTCRGWDELLISTPGACFFHTSSWARVLKESYGYTPAYFTEFGDKRVRTLIPFIEVNSFVTGRRGVSLPFTDFCGLIIGDANQFNKHFEYIKEFGRKKGWKSLELRGGENVLPDASPSVSYIGHTLNISRDEKSILGTFRDSTKRNINKAVKEGVEVKTDYSFEAFKEFYRLNCMTRKRHGLPPQPFHFFQKIFECIICKKEGFISLASFEGSYIAGAMFFQFGDNAIFKYGASDKKYHHLRANNLVMWQAIKRLFQDGHKKVFFGRTEAENLGLLQFKSGWGVETESLKYYKYDLTQDQFIRNGTILKGYHNKLFNHMPIVFSRIIGSMLYKHIG